MELIGQGLADGLARGLTQIVIIAIFIAIGVFLIFFIIGFLISGKFTKTIKNKILRFFTSIVLSFIFAVLSVFVAINIPQEKLYSVYEFLKNLFK